ncbi:adenosylmethionine decarboxylase [Lentisphaerota bacterium WC36G]|nr:adenosylmethionine decarboxylase [Lentisphaerae bacterium WC36]
MSSSNIIHNNKIKNDLLFDRCFALGKHMTIEYYECSSKILADCETMEKAFIKSAVDSNATVISSKFHDFKPQGVSGVVVISESHFAVHAWPEHDYAAVDIFTCGETIDFHAAVESLRESLESEQVIISSVMNRGIIGNNGVEKMVPVYEDRTHMYALSWERKFMENEAWGLTSSIDLYDCDGVKIVDKELIKEFIKKCTEKFSLSLADSKIPVCFSINDNITGFSKISNDATICGHLKNNSTNLYIDVFSCNYFEPREVAEFANEFFNAKHYRMQISLRR